MVAGIHGPVGHLHLSARRAGCLAADDSIDERRLLRRAGPTREQGSRGGRCRHEDRAREPSTMRAQVQELADVRGDRVADALGQGPVSGEHRRTRPEGVVGAELHDERRGRARRPRPVLCRLPTTRQRSWSRHDGAEALHPNPAIAVNCDAVRASATRGSAVDSRLLAIPAKTLSPMTATGSGGHGGRQDQGASIIRGEEMCGSGPIREWLTASLCRPAVRCMAMPGSDHHKVHGRAGVCPWSSPNDPDRRGVSARRAHLVAG